MVGEKLESLMFNLKLTPEDFALKIGVGKSSVYKLLRGDTKKITNSFAKKINAVFPQYGLDHLLSFNYSDSEKGKIDYEEQLTEEEIKIVSNVILLKEDQILKVPFFKKWLKEKKLEAKIEVYEKYEILKSKSG